jgi:hypothetical protein
MPQLPLNGKYEYKIIPKLVTHGHIEGFIGKILLI